MCGIAAVVAGPTDHFSRAELEEMTDLLHHRGPDHSAVRGWPHEADTLRLGIGHTRLSILDLSTRAEQPMLSADGSVSMVFNGEIYNYVELRRELMHLGHAFTSTGDTEVLLAAYLEWGKACFRRLVGMFAVLIVDERSNTLIAVRDPFGIKPLYYTRLRRGIALASEIKALTVLKDVSRSVDASLLLRYLRFGRAEDGENTLYAAIRQVSPGSLMNVSLNTGEVRTERYHRFEVDQLNNSELSFEEASDHLRSLFLASVEMHLRSDVPVGTALSGGIDSSSVVCCMRKVSDASAPLLTFAFTAPGTDVDEERWARLAAEASGAVLSVVTPTGPDLLEDLALLGNSWDEPLGGTSAYAQYRVFGEASKAGVRVMLDGQGADELLGGYRRYFSARVAGMLRRGELGAALGLLQRGRTNGAAPRRTLAEAADMLLPQSSLALLRRLGGRTLIPRYADSNWFAARGGVLDPVNSSHSRDVLHEQLAADLSRNMVPHLLRYEDTNSMLWSIESRVPFLTPELATFCLSLPESYLVDDRGVSKAVFRHAMQGIVPSRILARQDKLGFQPPQLVWLRAIANRHEALKADVAGLPFLDPDRLPVLWKLAAHDPAQAEVVWRLVFLAQWARAHHVAFA